jgi:perosamine synthetase
MSTFIPISQPSISEHDVSLVMDSVRSGWVSSLGPYIDSFEKRFAVYCGTRFALTTSNGTTGLHLALVAAGIKAGDEVIVPDLSFIATANAVAYCGAKPVMVDIDAHSLTICPQAVERAITPRTRAIVPVHLYGHPSDMDKVNGIARRHGLVVVEDAAEAHGAAYRGRRVGSLGLCGVFSFYGNKIITSGEGGMITTDDEALYTTARRLRDHAMSPSRRYWHDETGFNYRMTNMQAALGVAQLERIDDFIAARRQLMGWYRERLSINSRLRLNRSAGWAETVQWMVCVEVEGMQDAQRKALMQDLRERGIDSRPYFYPMSDMPMFDAADTPVAHRLAQSGLNLPFYVGLSETQVDFVCRQFQQALADLPT